MPLSDFISTMPLSDSLSPVWFPYFLSFVNHTLNPFSTMAFGPLSYCLRLNVEVICNAPRLATSGWLNLIGQGSHPLYDTTWLGRTTRYLCKGRGLSPRACFKYGREAAATSPACMLDLIFTSNLKFSRWSMLFPIRC